MRDYAKVAPQFWIGKTGRALRGGLEAQVVAAYLLSSPHANMLGLYYLPLTYLCHDTGLTMEGASKGLQRCIEAGFCCYDENTEIVWVVKMAEFQIGESLAPADKRTKGVQSEYDKLPDNKFLCDFYDRYHAAFNMENRRGHTSTSEAPSKPHGSQEQEQEREQEQKQKQSPQAGGKGSRAAKKAAKLQGLPEEARPYFEFAWGTFPTEYRNAEGKIRNLRLGEVQVVKLWLAILDGAFAGMLRGGEPANAEELACAAQFYVLAPHPQVAKGYASEIGVFYSISEKVDSKNLWAEAVNKLRDLRRAGKIEAARPWDGEPPMRSPRPSAPAVEVPPLPLTPEPQPATA